MICRGAIAAGFLSILPCFSFASDWIPLFDGKTTEGWTPRAEVDEFSAIDGELHLLSHTNVWVVSDREMADFEAELEVLLPEDAEKAHLNSGFGFRLFGDTGKPKGYQCEIEADSPGQNAGIFGIGLGGWLYPTKADQADFAAKVNGRFQKGQWNHFRVICDGKHLSTFLNGEKISEVEDSQSLRGKFGIQHHGKGGTIRFRNIRARELPSPSPESASTDHPNILWITVEDMSPTLGAYGDSYAKTPNLDRFAKESVLYTNAFATSPVCSPSRSSLITGMYSASMGTSQMRSAFPIPNGVQGFPSFLREAGYFTTNNVKTDYNTSDAEHLIAESWDESSDTAHWRSGKRKDGQPFFSVFNDMTTHQSRTMVWPYAAFVTHIQSKLSPDEIHDPEDAPVPPYYPDTSTVRKTIARYYDCISVMDQNVGRILDELEEDGLTDDTIVFFYSDHGSGMPRHKRLPHDSGMKVALMVRFPEKYQHLAPAAPGSTIDDLVSFVDYAPTVLSLASVDQPGYLQGRNFLKPDEKPEAEIIYGTRDRVDEVFEMSRSVRSDRYLYIRNYMPHLSWNQPSVFSDLGEIRQDITRYARENSETLSAPQRHYAGKSKAIEEFYDCKTDPDNINNLIIGELSQEQADQLEILREAFRKKRLEILDTGAIPETVMADYVRNEGAPFHDILLGKTNHLPDLEAAWSAADMVGTSDVDSLLSALEQPDPSVRFWAVIGLRNAASGDTELHDTAWLYLDDLSAPVRIETAFWLADASPRYREDALETLVEELNDKDWWTALRACRSIELLGEKARTVLPVMKDLYERTRNAPGDENFFLAFSSGAFLDKLGEPTEPWDFTPEAGSFSADPPPKEKD